MADRENEQDPNRSGNGSSPVTIAQVVGMLGGTLKAIDSVLFVFDRFCDGGRTGQWGLIRALFCWIGLCVPWLVYLIIQFSGTNPTLDEWFMVIYSETIPFVSVIFLAVVLPIVAAIAFTHKDGLSYCTSMIGLGGRFGCYSLVLIIGLEAIS